MKSGGNTMASTVNPGSALGMMSPHGSQMAMAGGGLTQNHSQRTINVNTNTGDIYESMMHGLVGSPRHTVQGHYPVSGFNSENNTATRLEIQTPSMKAMQVPLNAGYDTGLKGIDKSR